MGVQDEEECIRRVWNSRIDKYFQEKGLFKCPHEHALYCKVHENEDILIVCLYVDDLIFTGNNPSMFEDFKKAMARGFEMTNIRLWPTILELR